MNPTVFDLSITDIVVLLVMAMVLGIVVYFAFTNKRKLQKMILENEARNSLTPLGSYQHLDDIAEKRSAPRHEPPATFATQEEAVPMPAPKAQKHQPAMAEEIATPDMLYSLKSSIQQQQRALNELLTQVSNWDELEAEKENIKEEAEELKQLLKEKETELQKTKQQLSTSQKMAARIDEVYKEFDALQQKMASLEKAARQTNELAIELDDIKESNLQLKKEVTRKQDKLQETMDENQRLYRQLNETEDKLAEANLQRQQLMKKIQLLENLNAEFEEVSDANKKLQSELRRISELESMLSMISDERDILMKRRTS